MFEPNLSIDVSLLAIILGLHVTKNDRNLVLVLICILFAHVLLTNEDERDDSASSLLEETSAVATTVADDNLGAAASDAAGIATTDAPTLGTEPEKIVAADSFKTTLSSGVFDRQLSTPQTKLTSTVFPATSAEANGKLASARDSFFKSLVS